MALYSCRDCNAVVQDDEYNKHFTETGHPNYTELDLNND